MNVPSGYSALDLIGFTDKGDYSPRENYVKNDLSHHNGAIWKCLIDDTTGIEPVEGANWTLWIRDSNRLDRLADVEITTPQDGQEITYDATEQKWKNTSKIQSLTNEVKDMNNVYGSKNLMPFNLADIIALNKTTGSTWSGNNYTTDGITYTINDDGSVTANGTSTGNAQLNLAQVNKFLVDGTEYIASYGDWTYNANRYMFINGVGRIESPSGRKFTFDSSAHATGTVYIIIISGETVSNLTFYPMIRLASIEDDTYEPYAKTNQQLTEDTTALLDNMEVNDAVNILPNDGTTQTINGVTFTVNDDGTVTANGTATASLELVMTSTLKLDDKTYKISGCPSGGTTDTYKIDVQVVGGSYIAQDTGNGYIFTASSSKTYKVRIRILSGVTVSNLTFKPMITVPSYNGDYVPYAKSNKELTEDVESIEAEMVKGGGYVYALKNYFYHIAITASRGTGQYVKLITTNDEINALTSASAFNTNMMNQQKVIRNNSNASSTWTYSINGLTLNLNCTSQAIGCIISNFPLTFTTVDTSTPEANALNVLNLALLSNS